MTRSLGIFVLAASIGFAVGLVVAARALDELIRV